MNSRRHVLPVVAVLATSVMTMDRASAALSDVFGLSSVTISPSSGAATPLDVLTVQLGGVAGSSLVPMDAFIAPTSSTTRLVVLTTPNSVGATIPTSWSRQIMLGPLAAGAYDFSVRGIIGYGTPSQFVIGTELVFDNFLVVPEPASGLILVGAAAGLAGIRRRRA